VKVLVSGAGGFLGGHVMACLRAAGIPVRALVRSGRAGLVGAAEEVVEGDLCWAETLRAAVQGVDCVIHAGARVSTKGGWGAFEATNVRATDELIRLAVRAGVKRFVHVSSLSVYAVERDGATVTEDSPFEDAGAERGAYARSKRAADLVAQEWIGRGAPVTIVRPGLLYGPGRRAPLGRRVVKAGPLRVVLASRKYILPLAYVENIADAILLAATRAEAAGRAYTLVDHHVAQGEYLDLYRRVSGQRFLPAYVPPGILVAAAGAAEAAFKPLGRAPLSRHQVERTVRSATFDSGRARNELGWEPRVGIEEGLRRTLVGSP